MRQNGSIVGPYIEPTLGPASGVHSLSTQGLRRSGNVWPIDVSDLPYKTNLWAHYDASDGLTIFDSNSGGSQATNGGVVGRWEDKSGNARHLLQGTNNNRPLLRTKKRNDRNGIEFDGTNDGLTVISTLSNPCSICLVVTCDKNTSVFMRPDNTTATYLIYLDNNAAAITNTPATPTFYANGVDWAGMNATVQANVLKQYMLNKTYAIIFTGLNLSAWSGMTIADYSGFVWRGFVYEVVIYSETLSTTNVRNISRYLRSKWGTGTGLELV